MLTRLQEKMCVQAHEPYIFKGFCVRKAYFTHLWTKHDWPQSPMALLELPNFRFFFFIFFLHVSCLLFFNNYPSIVHSIPYTLKENEVGYMINLGHLFFSQVHPVLSRDLVTFIIICYAFDILTCATLFIR